MGRILGDANAEGLTEVAPFEGDEHNSILNRQYVQQVFEEERARDVHHVCPQRPGVQDSALPCPR